MLVPWPDIRGYAIARYKSICSMISAASRTNFGQRVMKSLFSSASFIPSEVLISQSISSLHVINPLRDLNSKATSLARLWAFHSSRLIFDSCLPMLEPYKHERTSHRTTGFTKMPHPTSESSGNFQCRFTTHTELFPLSWKYCLWTAKTILKTRNRVFYFIHPLKPSDFASSSFICKHQDVAEHWGHLSNFLAGNGIFGPKNSANTDLSDRSKIWPHLWHFQVYAFRYHLTSKNNPTNDTVKIMKSDNHDG